MVFRLQLALALTLGPPMVMAACAEQGAALHPHAENRIIDVAQSVKKPTDTVAFTGEPLLAAPSGIQFTEVELFDSAAFTAAGLTIGRSTGSMSLANIGTSPLSMIGYSITSPAGRLNSNIWLSIAEHFDGDNGAELDSDIWIRLTPLGARNDLSEVENPNGTGGVRLTAGQAINFGNAWRPGLIEDVTGQMLLLDGTTHTIAVQYINDAALPGDYNGDGIVNAADYTVWRNGGSPDDSQAGYNLWRTNFGRTSGSGAESGASASLAVPEPAGWLLALLAAALVGRRFVASGPRWVPATNRSAKPQDYFGGHIFRFQAVAK